VVDGRIVSHYEILEPIGRGGMGVVHKARDLKLGRLAAIKFISPALVGHDDARDRFLREARSLSALSHPHIATVYEVDEADGAPFLAMEYLPGGTLKDQIATARARGEFIETGKLLEWGLGLAEGLAHAHARRFVHRDVKSSNAMFDAEGRVKLTDFGLAKETGPDASTMGSVVGTPEYMSPEQMTGGAVDHRSDLYSLGVVLYELAALKLPSRTGAGDLPTLSSVRGDLPRAFDRVVGRLLSSAAADRYQSAQELAADLDLVRSGVEIPRFARRRRAPAISVAAIAILALGYFFWPKSAPLPEHKHIVVLPLRSIGGDANQDALCDGLTETLTTALTQTGLMSVVPTTEVRNVDTVQKAHRQFGANLALYGSLQRRGDRLKLTINLADAEGERQLGAETVEGSVDQPLQLEEAMLEKVASLVDVAVPAAVATGAAAPTPGAYDAYLRGRGFLYRFDRAGNPARALGEFDTAVRNDPQFALGYAGLAETQFLIYGQRLEPPILEAAKAAAEKALALNPRLGSAKATYGAILAAAGQADAGIAALEEAIEADPRNPSAYRELALVYQKQKKFDRAEEVFKKAIRARPGEWRSYMNLASFFAGRQRYQKAEPLYKKAIELSPDNHLPYRNFGAMLISLGRYQEAESMLRKAMSLNPTSRAASNLGTLYMFEKRYTEAVPLLEQAVEAAPRDFPNDYRIWGNLGDAYWLARGPDDKRTGAYRKAIDIATRVRASDPAGIDAALALYFAKLGEKEHARQSIALAVKSAPENAAIRFEAGEAYAILGDDEPALQELKEALLRGYAVDEVKRAPELEKLRDTGKLETVLTYARPSS
jgi:serine/threonine-protein kinase